MRGEGKEVFGMRLGVKKRENDIWVKKAKREKSI